jgi:molecular chaperone Hsp33
MSPAATNDTPDCLVRAITADGGVSVMVVTATSLVRDAVAVRPTSAAAAGALGRALMGSMLMAASKDTGETVQIQLRGRGALGTVTAISDSDLRARGTVANREAELDRRADGQPDVSVGVGRGILAIVRHHPSWREPYSGFVPMTLRDIAKDLTRYLMESEQAPSAMGLSVEHHEDGTVSGAAAFLVQALPGADDAVLAEFEANVKTVPRAALLVARDGMNADGLLDLLAGDIALGERTRATPTFECTCDKARAAGALRMLEEAELRELITSGAGQEVECQFCGRAYQLDAEDVRAVLAETAKN